MAAHPAKTAAHRRVLDAIGCGDPCPPMTAKTRDKMIALGLIVKLGDKVLGRDALGPITILQYEMPVAVHIDWCNAVAESEPAHD